MRAFAAAAVIAGVLLALGQAGSAHAAVTGTDWSGVASGPFTALVGPVTNTSVSPSTTAAGATGVTYTVQFTTTSTGQLVNPDTVTLTAPAGTFTGASFSIFDVTQNRNIGGSQVSNDGATAVLRITTGTATGANDVLRVIVTGATNSTAGPHSFQIETSKDNTPVTTPNYTLVAAQSVSNTSVVPSTTAAGVNGVTYTVQFKASSTGQLVFPGTVTLTAPSGTFTNASFSILDVTENRSIGGSQVSNDGSTAVLRVTTGTVTGANDVLRVTVTDATNSTAGPHSIGIKSSSDTVQATTPNYTLTTAQTVSNPSIVPSTTAAGAPGVTYTVEFNTSSTGQLVFPGTVTLTGPAGTFTNASFSILDVTENRSVGGSQVSNDGSTAVLRITTGTPTGPGDLLRITVTDATNSSAGAHSIGISTSSDPTPVSTPNYTLVAAQSASNASVVPSTTAAGVSGVSYTVQFTTSSTGQLTFPGTVTLTAPAGTFTNASFSILDVTENRSIGGSQVSNDGSTAVLRITTGTPTGANDVLRVAVTNATNSTIGPHNIQIKTSSDTTLVTTPNYTLVAAQAVSNASVVPSTTAAGATATYTVQFTTSSTGQLTFPGTVTLTGPVGTFTNASFSILDVTENRSIGGSQVSNDGSTAVLRITTGTPTGANDVLRVTVTNAVNSSTGQHSFQIETSSDPNPVSADYTLGADTDPPETTINSGPSGTTNDSTPSFTFTSDEAGSSFQCRVDGAAFANCTSPFTTAALADGPHTFEVRATDPAGNPDTSPASRSFTVSTAPPPDTTPPATTVTAGPSGPTDDDTPTFEFNANETGSSFECSVDGGPFGPCSSPFTTPALDAGQHTFSVRARDGAGNVGPASTSTFQVAPKQIEDLPPLTNSDVGRVAQVAPASGTVLIGVRSAAAARAGASQKGLTFVPLEEAREIPVGSFLDTSRGTVEMVSATGQGNRTQSGKFSAAVFQVLQSSKRRDRGLTELSLKGGNFKRCGSTARGSRTASAALSRRTIRRLRSSVSGRFRTRGRNSSATVRGTVWTTIDRCDGTLTQVRRGTVVVRDFKRRKNVVLRAGKSYLAKARR